MKIEYFITTDGIAIAHIPKSGSSSFGQMLAKQHYPNRIPTLAGANPDKFAGFQSYCERILKNDLQVSPLIPVREPVQRFISTARYFSNFTIDMFINCMHQKVEHHILDFHLIPTSEYLVSGAKLFKFPDHFAEMIESAKLSGSPARANINPFPERTDITDYHIQQVKEFYKKDIDLYNSITKAGEVWQP